MFCILYTVAWAAVGYKRANCRTDQSHRVVDVLVDEEIKRGRADELSGASPRDRSYRLTRRNMRHPFNAEQRNPRGVLLR
jgi:hypothetical protein